MNKNLKKTILAATICMVGMNSLPLNVKAGVNVKHFILSEDVKLDGRVIIDSAEMAKKCIEANRDDDGYPVSRIDYVVDKEGVLKIEDNCWYDDVVIYLVTGENDEEASDTVNKAAELIKELSKGEDEYVIRKRLEIINVDDEKKAVVRATEYLETELWDNLLRECKYEVNGYEIEANGKLAGIYVGDELFVHDTSELVTIVNRFDNKPNIVEKISKGIRNFLKKF